MLSVLLSRLIILLFGTLYPAYSSYKAIRTKNVKEYVKWMMYWIVFGFFTCFETFTDIFCSWFPFYYEVKILIVLWLLSPATKGSSTLYRKFVHPLLTRHEEEIDQYINQAKERGYSAVFQLGTKGVNYATSVIMQTAIKGGGNVVQAIKRSYSLSDLSEPDGTHLSIEDVQTRSMTMQPQQRILRSRAQNALSRSASVSRHSTGMYYTEMNISNKNAMDKNSNIASIDDISTDSHSVSSTKQTTTRVTRSRRGELLDMGLVDYDINELWLDDTNNIDMDDNLDINPAQISNLLCIMSIGHNDNQLNDEPNEIFHDCSSENIPQRRTKKRRAPDIPKNIQNDETAQNITDRLETVSLSGHNMNIRNNNNNNEVRKRRLSNASTLSTTSSVLKEFTSKIFRLKFRNSV